MDKINVVYIDDMPDTHLEKYFDKYYKNENYEICYNSVLFDSNDGYESLLNNPVIQSANIIFIDSILFENRSVTAGKFTGEEFKMVLNKFFPFIQIIVITQNEKNPDIDMLAKYNPNGGFKTPIEYYESIIPSCMDVSIKLIKQYRVLASRISDNDSWEKLLKERVLGTLNGTGEYDCLSKRDIDELICAFKEIEEHFK